MNATMMNREMNLGDEVFATLECNGRILANVRATQFSSVDEVVGYIYATAGAFSGLGRLTVRNRTQGWCQMVPVARMARRPLVA